MSESTTSHKDRPEGEGVIEERVGRRRKRASRRQPAAACAGRERHEREQRDEAGREGGDTQPRAELHRVLN